MALAQVNGRNKLCRLGPWLREPAVWSCVSSVLSTAGPDQPALMEGVLGVLRATTGVVGWRQQPSPTCLGRMRTWSLKTPAPPSSWALARAHLRWMLPLWPHSRCVARQGQQHPVVVQNSWLRSDLAASVSVVHISCSRRQHASGFGAGRALALTQGLPHRDACRRLARTQSCCSCSRR